VDQVKRLQKRKSAAERRFFVTTRATLSLLIGFLFSPNAAKPLLQNQDGFKSSYFINFVSPKIQLNQIHES
jgi:hypothetical protein